MRAVRWAAICAAGSMLLADGLTARAGDAREGAIMPVSQALCDDMKNHNVIRAGAPVGCERLDLIKFSYLGFDGAVHDGGEIMVMDAAAESVLRIFTKLREIRFPIAKARLINHYNGDDDASIADNNTSAFNSRNVAGTNTLSLHAYGLAIDINPVQNPYIKGKLTLPPDAKYDPKAPGTLTEDHSVTKAFLARGWEWGGNWKSLKDYQHFEKPAKSAK